MCGIAAIFAYRDGTPPVDEAELLAMREQMVARGPDGGGQWISDDGRVGLANRRLSIIDVSPAGAQPMFNADRSLAITFNGEIYNYAELRSELSVNGYQFSSTSDTEVVLALYATRGEAMLNELRGMYAFAIWDRDKQGIFLARDPFGIKPLYYSDNGHTLRLASQVKALRAGGKIDNAPEPAGHVGFFLWGHVPDPYTFFRSVRSLPAGSSMWVDRSGVRSPRKFCDVNEILRQAEESEIRNPKSEIRNSGERLRSALSDTVRYHLVAENKIIEDQVVSVDLESPGILGRGLAHHRDVVTEFAILLHVVVIQLAQRVIESHDIARQLHPLGAERRAHQAKSRLPLGVVHFQETDALADVEMLVHPFAPLRIVDGEHGLGSLFRCQCSQEAVRGLAYSIG